MPLIFGCATAKCTRRVALFFEALALRMELASGTILGCASPQNGTSTKYELAASGTILGCASAEY